MISLTTLSDIFTVPTSTSMLKTSSPIYDQTMDTTDASASTTGGDAANFEKMMHAKMIIAPSRQTAT